MNKLAEVAVELLADDSPVVQSLKEIEVAASAIAVIDNVSFVQVLVTRGYRSGFTQAFRRFHLTDPVPIAEALRSGEEIWIPTEDDWARRYPSRLSDFSPQWGRRGWAVVPFELPVVQRGSLSMSFMRSTTLSPEVCERVRSIADEIRRALAERLTGDVSTNLNQV